MSLRFEDIYELSPMQRGILFHSLYDPVGDVYFEQCVIRSGGPLDLQRFSEAWRTVIARHPILRTSFQWEGLEKPVQLVHPECSLSLDFENLHGLAPGAQQRFIDIYLSEDRAKGFDLSRAPLLRIRVFRIDANLHECVLSFHHLILDRWSRFLLLREVFDLAAGKVLAGEASPTPGFGAFIEWIQNQDQEEAEAFWRRTLAGFRLPISVLSERGIGAESPVYEEVTLRLSLETTAKLDAFARRNRLTMNTIVQGAWAILLSRYSGEEDVVFGATVAGRPTTLLGSDSIVGLFINTLPVRAKIQSDCSLVEWLHDLQVGLLEARRYEHTFLLDIQGWSDVPRGVPLFDNLVVFENVGVELPVSGAAGILEILRVRSVGRAATNYPLTLLAFPVPELSFKLVFDRFRLMPTAAAQLLEHLRVVLEHLPEMPDQPPTEIPLMTGAERRKLVTEWNATGVEFPVTETAHGLVAMQAVKTPDAIAVEGFGLSLTYAELQRRADRLAHTLRRLGVGGGVTVGIALERSLEMIVGVLGVLGAGGACLPLDPNYPKERLERVLEEARPPVVLVDRESRVCLDPDRVSGPRLLELDSEIVESDSEQPLSPGDPGALAYVLFTSGSTGRPKGIAMPHTPLVNLTIWQRARSTVPLRARTLQFSSLNFDVSFQEIFTTLASGGTLVLISEDARRDPVALSAFLATNRVERMFLPFVALQSFAEAISGGAELPRDLREVITAGEQLRISPEIENLFERLERCSLDNQYGPTETHVVTAFRLNGEPRSWPRLPPIGRPIANARVYLLDASRRPVPVGVPGEIYAGGLPLARGYLGNPARTAEKFLADPFVEGSGDRIYRTGDLGRYQENGQIEFLGRADNQVKIRGFRVEPAEIEAILEGHDSVRSAVVTAQEEGLGDRRLIAYIVPAADGIPDAGTLREFLQRSLPEYMLPSDYVVMTALPLTASGKVDRRSLPVPKRRQSGSEDLALPSTRIEVIVGEIFSTILHVDRIGLTDNFFSLGGHSLLATRVISQIFDSLGVRVPLRRLFERPTVQGFAASIDEDLNREPKPEDLDRILAEIRGLSDEEARLRLANDGDARKERNSTPSS